MYNEKERKDVRERETMTWRMIMDDDHILSCRIDYGISSESDDAYIYLAISRMHWSWLNQRIDLKNHPTLWMIHPAIPPALCNLPWFVSKFNHTYTTTAMSRQSTSARQLEGGVRPVIITNKREKGWRVVGSWILETCTRLQCSLRKAFIALWWWPIGGLVTGCVRQSALTTRPIQ